MAIKQSIRVLEENWSKTTLFQTIFKPFVSLCTHKNLFLPETANSIVETVNMAIGKILQWSYSREGLFIEISGRLFDMGPSQVLFTRYSDIVLEMCVFGPNRNATHRRKIEANATMGVNLVKEGGIPVYDEDGVFSFEEMEKLQEYDDAF